MPDRRAQLDETIRSFQEQAAKVAQLKDKMAELRGQARSADGSVVVTVAPSGAVLGLQLGPNAMRLSHTQLQQEIMNTIRQATQNAAQALQDTIVPVLGDKAAQFSEAFNAHSPVKPLGPDAAPDAPPPAAPQPPAGQPGWQQNRPQSPPATRNRPAASEVGDDDEGFGSFLR